MKLSLTIALVAFLGSISVESQGPRSSHKRRGSLYDRELFRLENLGRNGRRALRDSHGNHGQIQFHRRHHYRVSLEDLKRKLYYSEESNESDYGTNRELDNDRFDSSEESDWYRPGRHPCWGWRCSPQDMYASWTRRPGLRVTTQDLPTKKKWNSMRLRESSKNNDRIPEPVTTTAPIPALTVPPKPEFIKSRIAPSEELSITVTTNTPETNDITTLSSPETTTVSQAILDCIENCVATPEFNPVCGTNDETYDNIGKLFCAKHCGINVDLRRMSRCLPIFPFADDYDDYDGNDNSDGREGINDDDEDSGDDGVNGGFNDDGDGSGNADGPPLQTGRVLPSSRSGNPSLMLVVEQPPPPGDEVSQIEVVTPTNAPLPDLTSPANVESPSQKEERSLSDGEILEQPGGELNAVITTVRFLSSPTTNAPRFRRTTHPTDLQKCMKLCPVTTTYNPVCGTDLVTYINVDRIVCARECGLEVQILCEQPCSVCTGGRQEMSSTMTTTSASPTRSETIKTTGKKVAKAVTVLDQCISSCPVTTEYNPVCGTDNISYMNPVHLLCVQVCGSDVKVARFGPCIPDITEAPIATSEKAEEDVTVSPAVIECTKRCVVTSEYNPVCGTNEETYTNPGRLECAKYCGIDVQLNYRGLCNGFFFSGFTSSQLSNDRSGLGSQATANAAREILQSTMPTTRLPLRTSTLPSITSKAASTSVITKTHETPTSTNFTLAPNVLSSIFGDVFVAKSMDMTTTEDELHIDLRLDNEDEKPTVPKKNLDPNRIVFPE